MPTDPPSESLVGERIASVAQEINALLADKGLSIDEGVLALATVLEAMLRSSFVPKNSTLIAAVETFCGQLFVRPH